jgi:aspartate/methionine/tyrosine aminotransferase
MPQPVDHHILWARSEARRHRHRLSESDVDAPDLEAMGLPSQATLPRASEGLEEELERALGALWDAPHARVMLTAGGSEANAIVFGALLERGDEVLVESPGYQPHREVPRLFDIPVRRFERPLSGGTIVPAIDRALSSATRMIVLTDPHNPSGVLLGADDLRALTELAERRGLWILCDEIFRDASAGPRGTSATLGPRWIVTSSLTKVYGLGALRLGWIAGDGRMLERCGPVQNALSASPSVPSIALALALVPHLDTLRARSLALLDENRSQWAAIVAAGVPFTTARLPQGTTAWALFPGPGEGEAFAAFASNHFGLALTPGRFFSDPRGVRVGLGGEPARSRPAFQALRDTLAAYAASDPRTRDLLGRENP